ncbi:MAG: hypothetical protein WC967_07625 [Balneolaceae bacterium]
MSVEQELETKYQLMLAQVRNSAEEEILEVIYKGVLEMRLNGQNEDVNMEDLMAHALQEAKTLIDRLANNEPLPDNARGRTLWDIRMVPGNDLLGNVSWSVWQAITANYLIYGRHFSESLANYFDDFIVKYGIVAGQNISAAEADINHINKATNLFKKKLAEIEGEEKAKQMLSDLLDNVGDVIKDKPTLHVQVIASLVQANYNWLGVRNPFAVRAYYWLDYQQYLNPNSWLGPVHISDITLRGDYGKQVTLGNSYNDRGFLFWYLVTGDYAAVEQINKQWKDEPARITKADLMTLKNEGFIHYSDEIYFKLLALLPE